MTPSFFGIPALMVAGWMAAAVGVLLLVLLVLAMFNRILLKMALRNIPRRRAQTVLILFGLMLATLITTASLAVGDTLTYSLVAIQLPQLGGVDEAFTRHPNHTPQGAATTDADFFSPAQAAAVIARSTADPNVATALGVLVAPGGMVDATTNQASSKNVAVFGAPPDFSSVWGTLRSRSGTSLDVTALGESEVFIGNALADRLNAHSGDTLSLFVDGHPTSVTVRDVLDTEVNPNIAIQGPIVNSVLMRLDTMRTLVQRPSGYNLILLHNRGSGGLDDLGPGGATGSEITRTLRSAFTDSRAAQELWDYLNTPAIKAQLTATHDGATFLDPTKDISGRLLVELNKAAVTDEFKGLAGDSFTQQIMSDAVSKTVPKSANADTQRAAQDELRWRIDSLQVDSTAAVELKSLLARPDIQGPLEQLAASLPAGDPGRAAITGLFVEVARQDLSPKFRSLVGNPALQKELTSVVGAIAPGQLTQFNDIARRLSLYQYTQFKADAVIFGQITGLVGSGALLGVSFFSIAVGVLLIFLIFVMLAAERRAEMGMSRAVGLKRRHLTQMFLFEGTAYTLAASVVGVVFGVLVGMLMMRVISGIFTGFYKGMDLQYHVEWTSLVVAICMGILLTFIVVAFSAYRVSRLNIVAAIRDLDESEHRDEGIISMFLAPFRVAWAGIKQLLHGHPLVFLHRITLGVLGSIRTFWWALFRRGPMTIVLGGLLIFGGVQSHSESVYTAGISLVIVGAGLLVKWILMVAHVRQLVAGRVGFTAAAVGLLVYWGRPFGRMEDVLHVADAVQLKKLTGGPEVFALTALMVLLGAIWLVMYNSDLLIRGVMFFTGRIGALAPITRTSMAYPMATKFRTGMAVAMFAIVTFMIVYMSVFKDVLLQNFGQPEVASGGWQLVVGSPDLSAQSSGQTVPADVASLVRADPTVSGEVRGVGWENLSQQVNLHQVRADGTVDSRLQAAFEGSFLHVVDNGYLTTTGYALQPRAAGYTSDRAVWDAIRDQKGFAVIDAVNLDSIAGNPAIVSGIKPTDSSFQPFQVQVTAPNNPGGTSTTTWTLTVIGFMTRPLWSGAYISTRTAMESGLFAPDLSTAQPTAPAKTLGTPLPPLAPTGYYFALNRGVDENKARLDLGRMLVKDQLEPVVVKDQLALQLSSFLTLLNLISGFLALGLIVGIAGLGVISTRAVVERWQQIGMLRALGYRRSLVQRSFLMESSLIAILGLVIGALVGVLESYRFFVTDKTFGTVEFHVPLTEIGLILVGAYVATLLTTYLPARAASRVAPAEALRYE